jgi:hypothetical protein
VTKYSLKGEKIYVGARFQRFQSMVTWTYSESNIMVGVGCGKEAERAGLEYQNLSLMT